MSHPEDEQAEAPNSSITLSAPETLRNVTSATKKRKKKSSSGQTLSQFSIRRPTWAYIHLQHLSFSTTPSSTADLDSVTVQLHLQAALTTFLGLHGSAIPIDLLKLQGKEIWIRIPSEDRSALIAAVGGWVGSKGEGWRIKGWSHWNANATGKDAGQDLFED